MIEELNLIDNIDLLKESKIALYGAGYQGVLVLKKLKEAGIPASYLFDGDPHKWGAVIEGVKVLSLTDLARIDAVENLAIIITTDRVHFIDQIIDDIRWLKLRTDNVFTLFGLNISLEYSGKLTQTCGGNYYNIRNMRRDIFYATWAAEHLEMFANWSDKADIFLIYSLPKTGTSTIRRSLKEIGIYADHFHRIVYEPYPFLKELKKKHRLSIQNILETRSSVKIVSMVREPLSRILSNIFHIAERNEVAFYNMPPGKPFIDSLTETMQSGKFIISGFDPYYESLNWFDNELKTIFGIDVFAYPFDKEKGYSIIKQGNVELCLMKIERLNSLEQIIAKFIGVPRFKLINDNESENKVYKYLYKQVLEEIRIPREVVDAVYTDPRITHFYSTDDISDFLKKWEKNIY
jgi:hypothetical protein